MKVAGYVSSFLSADDVRTPKLIFIAMVTEEEVGKEPKLVLRGNGQDGEEIKIALNKTNVTKLIEIFGTDESDEWIGEAVVAWRDPSVKFGGKSVGGIAFRKPKSDVSKLRPAAAPSNSHASDESDDGSKDDSIPF